MKAYVITTGLLFALLTLVHVWRMVLERHLAADLWFIAFTVLSAGMTLWAWFALRRASAAG